ncbi:MAG: hypothetical protein ACRD0P_06685 [Stackebrandtia sp.]
MTHLPSLASLDEVEILLAEPLEGRQRDRARAVLDAVSAEAREVTGRTWVSGGELSPEAPALVGHTVARATERAIRNPQGLSSEGLGDYNRRFADGTGPSGAGVYLSEGERAALERLADLGDLVSVETVRDAGAGDITGQLAHGSPDPPGDRM